VTTAVSSRLCFLAQVLQFRHEHGAPLHLCQRSRTGGQFVMQPEGSALDGGGKYSSCTSVQLSAPGSAQSTKDRRSSSKSSPTENPGNHLQRTEGGLRRRVADEWEAGPWVGLPRSDWVQCDKRAPTRRSDRIYLFRAWERVPAPRMRITFEQFNHPVVRGELEPITELKGIYVFAAIPGALNHLGKERERGSPHEVALPRCEFLPVRGARHE